ncbi:MAG: hypothetical protein AAF529_01105 [Pseudomonadota bacterium]
MKPASNPTAANDLLKISGRGVIATIVVVLGCTLLVINLAWQHNPQQFFHTAEAINWFGLCIAGLLTLILSGGACLSLYTVTRLIRNLWAAED